MDRALRILLLMITLLFGGIIGGVLGAIIVGKWLADLILSLAVIGILGCMGAFIVVIWQQELSDSRE